MESYLKPRMWPFERYIKVYLILLLFSYNKKKDFKKQTKKLVITLKVCDIIKNFIRAMFLQKPLSLKLCNNIYIYCEYIFTKNDMCSVFTNIILFELSQITQILLNQQNSNQCQD